MSLLFCTYKQSYQWRLIKITFRCRKIKNLCIKIHLLPTSIIVSLEPCPLSPIFWCFRAGFWYKISLQWGFLYISYSDLNRQLDLLHHFASQFRPRKVMRSLVASHFLAGAAAVVDAPLNCTTSCQCALWSLRPFQLSSLWRWSCDGKSTRIALPPSRTTALLIGVVQSSQVNVIVLLVQPSHSIPFSLLFLFLLAHFYLDKVLNILCH